MTLLISKTDYVGFSHIAETLDATKFFNAYVYQAQSVSLRHLLGESLYSDLITNYTTSKYDTLLDGCIFTYFGEPCLFDGLKALIVFYAENIYLNESRVISTQSGLMKKANESSQEVTAQELSEYRAKTKNAIINLENQLEKYLIENTTLFPYFYGLNKTQNLHGIIS